MGFGCCLSLAPQGALPGRGQAPWAGRLICQAHQVWAGRGSVSPPLPRSAFVSRRLVQLAPQYFLSNLPASESRDLLMALREKITGAADLALAQPIEESPAPRPAEEGEEDACVLQ